MELMRCVAVYPLPPRELLDQLQKMDVDIPDNYDLAAHMCELDCMPSCAVGLWPYHGRMYVVLREWIPRLEQEVAKEEASKGPK